MAPELAGKRVLVVGLARSGVAAANFLTDRGATVTVNDLRPAGELSDPLSRLNPNVSRELGHHPPALFLEPDLIVVSPGVPVDLEPLAAAAARRIPVWAEVELAFRFLEGPLIGVTGSNGKTTTTSLIGSLFEAAGRPCRVAGNIGRPLIDVVAEGPSPETTAIVELSSFQLETIDMLRPDVALLLNITPDHLDRHRTMEAYQQAKERIFKNQRAGDTAVLNLDDPRVGAVAGRVRSAVMGFSRRGRPEARCRVVGDRIILVADDGAEQDVCGAGEVALMGSHNLENVLAAVAAGAACGLPAEAMAEACRSFRGVPHRLEKVARLGGVTFYNDSKATNADAALKALEAFEGSLVVIMGGLAKGGDFRSLREAVSARVRRLVLLGQAAAQLEKDLGDLVPVQRAATLEDAVEAAAAAAAPDGIVLLAPACASFDMFKNFEHRGEVFKESVRALELRRGKG